MPLNPIDNLPHSLFAYRGKLEDGHPVQCKLGKKENQPGKGETWDLASLRVAKCHTQKCKELYLKGLHLTKLPENIPIFVKHLNVDNNNLLDLDKECITRLKTLSAKNNPGLKLNNLLHAYGISHQRLPSKVVGFDRRSKKAGIKYIYQSQDQHQADGNIPVGSAPLRSSPKDEANYIWIEPWITITNEKNYPLFRQFLCQLRKNEDIYNDTFIPQVKSWLNDLALDSNTQCRRSIFALLDEYEHTAKSNLDMMIFYQSMQVIMLSGKVATGFYDKNNKAFFLLARGYYIQDRLQKKYINIAASTTGGMEQEADMFNCYLRDVAQLNALMPLPINPLHERFSSTERKTRAQLKRRHTEIEQPKEDGLIEFLINNFPPWLEALKRWDRKRYDTALRGKPQTRSSTRNLSAVEPAAPLVEGVGEVKNHRFTSEVAQRLAGLSSEAIDKFDSSVITECFAVVL